MTRIGLRFKNLTYEVAGRKINSNLSVCLPPGKLLVVIGPSGSGKTTFGRSVAGLDGRRLPFMGERLFNDVEVSELTPGQWRAVLSQIGVMEQHFIPDHGTVRHNVDLAIPIEERGADGKRRVIPVVERRARVAAALKAVGLEDKADVQIFDKKGELTLSGGEAQRVGVARHLAGKKKILVADEPTANVDENNAVQVIESIEELRKLGNTGLLITHDTNALYKVYRRDDDRIRVLHLEDGKIVSEKSSPNLEVMPEGADTEELDLEPQSIPLRELLRRTSAHLASPGIKGRSARYGLICLFGINLVFLLEGVMNHGYLGNHLENNWRVPGVAVKKKSLLNQGGYTTDEADLVDINVARKIADQLGLTVHGRFELLCKHQVGKTKGGKDQKLRQRYKRSKCYAVSVDDPLPLKKSLQPGGRIDLTGNNVVLGEHRAKLLGAKVGDEIELQIVRPKMAPYRKKVRVAGIISENNAILARNVVMGEAMLHELFDIPDNLFHEAMFMPKEPGRFDEIEEITAQIQQAIKTRPELQVESFYETDQFQSMRKYLELVDRDAMRLIINTMMFTFPFLIAFAMNRNRASQIGLRRSNGQSEWDIFLELWASVSKVSAKWLGIGTVLGYGVFNVLLDQTGVNFGPALDLDYVDRNVNPSMGLDLFKYAAVVLGESLGAGALASWIALWRKDPMKPEPAKEAKTAKFDFSESALAYFPPSLSWSASSMARNWRHYAFLGFFFSMGLGLLGGLDPWYNGLTTTSIRNERGRRIPDVTISEDKLPSPLEMGIDVERTPFARSRVHFLKGMKCTGRADMPVWIVDQYGRRPSKLSGFDSGVSDVFPDLPAAVTAPVIRGDNPPDTDFSDPEKPQRVALPRTLAKQLGLRPGTVYLLEPATDDAMPARIPVEFTMFSPQNPYNESLFSDWRLVLALLRELEPVGQGAKPQIITELDCALPGLPSDHGRLIGELKKLNPDLEVASFADRTEYLKNILDGARTFQAIATLGVGAQAAWLALFFFAIALAGRRKENHNMARVGMSSGAIWAILLMGYQTAITAGAGTWTALSYGWGEFLNKVGIPLNYLGIRGDDSLGFPLSKQVYGENDLERLGIGFGVAFALGLGVLLHGTRKAVQNSAVAVVGQTPVGTPAPSDSFISLRGVSTRYEGDRDKRSVLAGVSLDIKKGAHVVITGDSGAGKSTLLKSIIAQLRPSEGILMVGGERLDQIGANDEKAQQRVRNQIGITSIPQDLGLFDDKTVRENIYLVVRKVRGLRVKEAKAITNKVIEQMELGLVQKTLVKCLSGGERQRVAIARALAFEPKLLAIDEATAHLDGALTTRFEDRLEQLRKEKPEITIVQVSHDKEARRPGRRIIVMNRGQIVEDFEIK